MKLYLCPGACSLADHIALLEAGATFEREAVDLSTKQTSGGADFSAINPKGYVPALVFDDGDLLTENIAVLDWIAGEYPALGLPGARGRTRLLEALAYISTEVHKSFKPFFHDAPEPDKAYARNLIGRRMTYLSEHIVGEYLFGATPTVADFYLFVTLMWSGKFGIAVPEPLADLRDRMFTRPAVIAALRYEGLM